MVTEAELRIVAEFLKAGHAAVSEKRDAETGKPVQDTCMVAHDNGEIDLEIKDRRRCRQIWSSVFRQPDVEGYRHVAVPGENLPETRKHSRPVIRMPFAVIAYAENRAFPAPLFRGTLNHRPQSATGQHDAFLRKTAQRIARNAQTDPERFRQVFPGRQNVSGPVISVIDRAPQSVDELIGQSSPALAVKGKRQCLCEI